MQCILMHNLMYINVHAFHVQQRTGLVCMVESSIAGPSFWVGAFWIQEGVLNYPPNPTPPVHHVITVSFRNWPEMRLALYHVIAVTNHSNYICKGCMMQPLRRFL